VLRYLLLTTFLLIASFATRAQLKPKLAAAASRYFISLPYEKKFADWIKELEKNKYVLSDSGIHIRPRGMVFGANLAQKKPFVETDTARIWVVKELTTIRGLDSTGRKMKYYVDWAYILNQEYKFLKKNTLEKEFKAIVRVIMNDFRKSSYVTYLGIKNSRMGQRLWIANSVQEEPMIEMLYGSDKLSYFIRFRLHFAVNMEDR
jgi:hypothetical protein